MKTTANRTDRRAPSDPAVAGSLRALLIALALVASSTAQAADGDRSAGPSAVASAFAASALAGLKLAVQKGLADGKVSPAKADCVQKLDSSSFYGVFESLLGATLSPDERPAAEAFFRTAVGRKYAKFGLAQVYTSHGETPPEPAPAFSAAEYKELEDFSRTPAGDKLLVRDVLNGDAAHRELGKNIQSLLATCGKAG